VDAVTRTTAALAVVVVNPLVIEELLDRPGFEVAVVIEVDKANRTALPGRLLEGVGWKAGKGPPATTEGALTTGRGHGTG